MNLRAFGTNCMTEHGAQSHSDNSTGDQRTKPKKQKRPSLRRQLLDLIHRLLTTPTEELGRWQFTARFFLEVARTGGRRLKQDRAGQMAAALAYRTLFSLIPVTVMGMVIFQALGGIDMFHDAITNLLHAAELDAIQLPGADGQTITVSDWAQDLIRQLEGLSFKTIGVVGLAVFAWAAIGLLTTIERSFNTICQAPEHRAIHRRVPLYWMTITIGPVLVAFSFYIRARFNGMVEEMEFGGNIVSAIGYCSSFGATWLFLLGLYLLMPNTRIGARSAAIGSATATVLWTVGVGVLNGYIAVAFTKSPNLSLLYGSLGLIPVFMVWTYIMWLVVLFGLEVASTLQMVGGKLDPKALEDRRPLPVVVDPTVIIPLMHLITKRFDRGLTTTSSDVTETLRLNSKAVSILLSELVNDDILHRLDMEDSSDAARFALARHPAHIEQKHSMHVVF